MFEWGFFYYLFAAISVSICKEENTLIQSHSSRFAAGHADVLDQQLSTSHKSRSDGLLHTYISLLHTYCSITWLSAARECIKATGRASAHTRLIAFIKDMLQNMGQLQ